MLSLFSLYPTLRWSTLGPDQRAERLEAWQEQEKAIEKAHWSEKLSFSLKKWWQGDNDRSLNLGLDLQGGMHLILEVDTHKAIENETVRLKEAISKYMKRKDLKVQELSLKDSFILIEGADDREKTKKMLEKAFEGLDIREEGSNTLMVNLNEDQIDDLRDLTVRQVLETIRGRVDQFGVAEPLIQRQSEERILIQLPGLKDPSRVMKVIGRTAQLTFHLVRDGPDEKEKLLAKYNGNPPVHLTLMPSEEGLYYILEKEARVTGADLKDARLGHDDMGRPAVNFQMNARGSQTFGELTEAHINERLAIVLDGKVQSAPVIRSKITSSGQITGQFTLEEAKDLAVVLRVGALPAPVNIVEERTVGPTLGRESIQKGIMAALVGLLLTIIYMSYYYRIPGVIACLALTLNILFLLAALASLRATLTLPGLAGIVLTIGMSVDANVLIYERLREELEKGKTLRISIATGYSKAFSAILDSNLTTLLTSVILLKFGTGPVKGFAVTLSIGILISMFTALVVTRVILDLLTKRRALRSLSIMNLFKGLSYPFISRRNYAFALSLLLIFTGMTIFVIKGKNNFGVDFTQGTLVQLGFQRPISTAEVRNAISKDTFGDVMVQQYGGQRGILLRASSTYTWEKIEAALQKSYKPGEFEVERVEMVGPAVSKDLTHKAFLALLYSVVGMLIYISFRFKYDFAVAAVVALVHDVLITLGALALTHREISLPVVAALLTLIGYSINDTIVIYDRIREEMKLSHFKSLVEVMNLSINKTLSRTFNTSGTTLVTLLALLFLGGEVINDFAFALTVGIITGTYSSVFVAAPLTLLWRQRSGPSS